MLPLARVKCEMLHAFTLRVVSLHLSSQVTSVSCSTNMMMVPTVPLGRQTPRATRGEWPELVLSSQTYCSYSSCSWLWHSITLCSVHRLTAFVARSFGQASSHIYIDKGHVQDAVLWLRKHQLPSGCFQSVGKLFNNDLKVWPIAMEVGLGGA